MVAGADRYGFLRSVLLRSVPSVSPLSEKEERGEIGAAIAYIPMCRFCVRGNHIRIRYDFVYIIRIKKLSNEPRKQ